MCRSCKVDNDMCVKELNAKCVRFEQAEIKYRIGLQWVGLLIIKLWTGKLCSNNWVLCITLARKINELFSEFGYFLPFGKSVNIGLYDIVYNGIRLCPFKFGNCIK